MLLRYRSAFVNVLIVNLKLELICYNFITNKFELAG